MGSVFGDRFKISVFGESHGPAIGVVLDGLPPGIRIDFDRIEAEMARRRAKSRAYLQFIFFMSIGGISP